jgi:pyruvate/2-oxoglutarate dehydrogenase complex dihydrolipoamide acyltransferase (E2) component
MKYRNVGNHAEDLADGRMVGPGEYVEIDDEQLKEGRNADLIDTGVFIEIGEVQATDSAKQLAEKEGVQLEAVTGTGKDGQVTQQDVERHIREQNALQNEEA